VRLKLIQRAKPGGVGVGIGIGIERGRGFGHQQLASGVPGSHQQTSSGSTAALDRILAMLTTQGRRGYKVQKESSRPTSVRLFAHQAPATSILPAFPDPSALSPVFGEVREAVGYAGQRPIPIPIPTPTPRCSPTRLKSALDLLGPGPRAIRANLTIEVHCCCQEAAAFAWDGRRRRFRFRRLRILARWR
jgi:hypothetical protein